jgi:hypothetical protein
MKKQTYNSSGDATMKRKQKEPVQIVNNSNEQDRQSTNVQEDSQKSLESLKQWASDWIVSTKENEEILFPNQFRMRRGISIKTWNLWLRESVDLKEAEKEVLEIIAVRRELGAIENKYNAHIIGRSMPIYSKDWKELEEWRSTLNKKNEAAESTQRIQVILEQYPNSSLVPEKKKEYE